MTTGPLTLIVKPVAACNASCVYCCSDRDDGRRMGPGLLDLLFERIARSDVRKVLLLWHGGEPLLAGAGFFRSALEHTRQLTGGGFQVEHTFQTNLLAADGEMLDLLIALSSGHSVSSSVEPIAGVRRVGDDPDAYLRLWLKRYDSARRRGLGVNLVYVVHQGSLARVASLYRYFRNLGVAGVRFNPVYPSIHRPAAEEMGISPEQWGEFLILLRRAWLEDQRTLRVEPLAEWEDLVRGSLPQEAGSCAFTNGCGRGRLAIGPDGEVHSCGRAADRGDRPLGRITAVGLDHLLSVLATRSYSSRRGWLEEHDCAECTWWSLCRGGCPDDAQPPLSQRPTRWCESYKRYFAATYPDAADSTRG